MIFHQSPKRGLVELEMGDKHWEINQRTATFSRHFTCAYLLLVQCYCVKIFYLIIFFQRQYMNNASQNPDRKLSIEMMLAS